MPDGKYNINTPAVAEHYLKVITDTIKLVEAQPLGTHYRALILGDLDYLLEASITTFRERGLISRFQDIQDSHEPYGNSGVAWVPKAPD